MNCALACVLSLCVALSGVAPAPSHHAPAPAPESDPTHSPGPETDPAPGPAAELANLLVPLLEKAFHDKLAAELPSSAPSAAALSNAGKAGRKPLAYILASPASERDFREYKIKKLEGAHYADLLRDEAGDDDTSLHIKVRLPPDHETDQPSEERDQPADADNLDRQLDIEAGDRDASSDEEALTRTDEPAAENDSDADSVDKIGEAPTDDISDYSDVRATESNEDNERDITEDSDEKIELRLIGDESEDANSSADSELSVENDRDDKVESDEATAAMRVLHTATDNKRCDRSDESDESERDDATKRDRHSRGRNVYRLSFLFNR